jgi:hypothetical protein
MRNGLRILVPIPVRESELGITCELAADLLKVEQVRAMPIKEVSCTVFAKVESAWRAMDRGYGVPISQIACRQGFHCRNRIAIGLDVRVDFW